MFPVRPTTHPNAEAQGHCRAEYDVAFFCGGLTYVETPPRTIPGKTSPQASFNTHSVDIDRTAFTNTLDRFTDMGSLETQLRRRRVDVVMIRPSKKEFRMSTSDTPAPPPTPRRFGDLAALTEAARLPLDEERREAIGGILANIYGILDALDDVELDNVLPATHFDARWE